MWCSKGLIAAALLCCAPAFAADPVLSVLHGGTGGTTPSSGRAGLGAAASGANFDITSIAPVTVTATGSLKLSFCTGYVYGNSGTGVTCSSTVPVVNVTGALVAANNLSDLASPSTARVNLGLGTLAQQGANLAAITGGTIDGTVIGGVARAAGSFTALLAGTSFTLSGCSGGYVFGNGASATTCPTSIPAASVAGLSAPATAPFGTTTGTVADGGVAAASTAGVAALNASSALMLPGGWKAGNWYGPLVANGTANTALATASRLFAYPVCIPNAVTLKKLGFYIGTANSSAFNVRLYVFSDTGSGAAGNMVADSGVQNVAATTTGNVLYTLAANVSLPKGCYWPGFAADATGASIYSISANAAGILSSYMLGSGTPGGASGLTSAAVLGVYKTTVLTTQETAFGTPTSAGGTLIPITDLGL